MAAITIGVVPSAIPGDRTAALAELCVALSERLKTKVSCVHPASYADLVGQLERDRVQYAWMSPALMVMAGEDIQLRPLLSAVRNSRGDYSSALFVAASGPYTELAQLRGTTIAWVDHTSAAGYLYPRIQLAARGIDAGSFFKEELFVKSHAEVVKAVREGRAQVGATYAEHPSVGEPVTRAGFIDAAPDWEARVLEWTATIPNDLIAGHGLLDKTSHHSFSTAILALGTTDEGQRLLHNAFAVDRFVTIPRNALEPLRAQVQRAREHGLLAHL